LLKLKKWLLSFGFLLLLTCGLSLTFLFQVAGIVDVENFIKVEKIEETIDLVSSIKIVVGER